MSKLTDYSKFDHIGDGDSSDDEGGAMNLRHPTGPASQNNTPVAAAAAANTTTSAAATANPPQSTSNNGGPSMRRNPENNRFVYEFNGNPIYEWEQTLDEVILYIPAPPIGSAKDLYCKITPHHLQVGLQEIVKQKGGPMFLDEDTFGTVDEDASTWTLEDKTMLVIYLIKANPGMVWEKALKGRQDVEMDPMSKEQVRKDLMLERFQQENPGMDFRGAEFNGSVPDPRTFMGGMKHQ